MLIGLFIVHALRVPAPLLDLHLYRRRTFASASFAMFCLGAALFGSMILLPLYWQDIRHESVVNTGLLTAPLGIGMALVMPLAGKLTDRWGGGPLALFGVTLTTLATIPFGLIGAHTPIPVISVAMLIRGMGIGFAFMPAMAAAFASLDRSELSHATPQLNVLQRVGGSIGTAVLAVVLQRALVGAHTLSAQADAYGTAFWFSAGLTALAIVPCIILVRAERAARAAKGDERPSARGAGRGRGRLAAASAQADQQRRVVGHRLAAGQRPVGPDHLAVGLKAAHEQVIHVAGRHVSDLRPRCLRVAQVQVAAEDERRVFRPVERQRPGARELLAGQPRHRAGVEVGHAHAVGEPGELEHAPLGPAPQAHGAVGSDRRAREDRVRAPAVRLDEIRPAAWRPPGGAAAARCAR